MSRHGAFLAQHRARGDSRDVTMEKFAECFAHSCGDLS